MKKSTILDVISAIIMIGVIILAIWSLYHIAYEVIDHIFYNTDG